MMPKQKIKECEEELKIGDPVVIRFIEGELPEEDGLVPRERMPKEVCMVGIVMAEDKECLCLLRSWSYKNKDIILVEKDRILEVVGV